MKVSEVKDSDMKNFAQLINCIHAAEFKLNGKDVCSAADSIRWLQGMAKLSAESYSKEKMSLTSEPEQEMLKKEDQSKPTPGGLPSGVEIKSYSAGKPARGK